MAVDRSILAQALAQGQQTSQMALDPSNFGGGRAGNVGLAAQLATAGIGAFTQYRAQKELQEQELASQKVFSQKFPHLADIASTLSPETRQAYTVEVLKNSLKSAEPMSPVAKLTADYKAGLIDEPTYQASLKKETSSGPQTVVNVGEQQNFKNATQLRGEYSDRSKNFIGIKEGYEKVVTAAQDPSPAGDLALVYGYVKAQDPTSTVREAEFKTTEDAKAWLDKNEQLGITIPSNISSAINKLATGSRLLPTQRADFVDRTTRFYKQAEKSQQKLADQYIGIAKRNQLNPQDVIVDFTTSIEGAQPPKQMPTVAKQPIRPVNQLSVGTVKNGYKYIGGNPAKPESWQKI